MITKQPGLILKRFPLVIDPGESLLEVLARREDSEDCSCWMTLYRLEALADSFDFSRTTAMVHFFGDAPSVVDSSLALIYDATGFLRFRVDRDALGFWKDPDRFSEELVGKPVLKPSLRLVFDDPGSARECLRLLRSVHEGEYRAAYGLRLAELLQGLIEPPRPLLVSTERDVSLC